MPLAMFKRRLAAFDLDSRTQPSLHVNMRELFQLSSRVGHTEPKLNSNMLVATPLSARMWIGIGSEHAAALPPTSVQGLGLLVGRGQMKIFV